MATYLILNVLFMSIVLLAFGVRRHVPSKAWGVTVIMITILTAVFDSVIVGLSIVAYNYDKILGVFVCNAPVEDFSYALLACIIVPFLWNSISMKGKKKK